MKLLMLTLVLTQTVYAQSAAEVHRALSTEASRLRAWGTDRAIVDAVKRRNAVPVPLDEVKRIDREWIAGGQKALKKSLTSAPCADRLRGMAIEGVHGEIFVTDARGAIVCATSVTSDYWQGDELKFANALKGSTGSVFIDRPRFDESSATTVAQISVPVLDGDKAIGVMVVGVVAGKIARR